MASLGSVGRMFAGAELLHYDSIWRLTTSTRTGEFHLNRVSNGRKSQCMANILGGFQWLIFMVKKVSIGGPWDLVHWGTETPMVGLFKALN